jgi:multiple sugar transport system substrate-binding protein
MAALALALSRAGLGSLARAQGVTLEMLNNNWGEVYNNLMLNISTEYTAAHPDVTFNWTFSPEWETNLLTRIVGGAPPDATYTNYSSQASLAAKSSFIPLDDYVAAAGLDRSDFIASMYDSCLWEDKLYALPGGADFLGMYWNKDVYTDAGLDPEKPPTTLDELMAHSEAILQKDADGNLLRLGFVPTAANFISFAYLFGGSFYDAETRTITANHPGNVEALEWLTNYAKKLDPNKVGDFIASNDVYSATNPFASKRLAHHFDGFWLYASLDQFAPDINYGVTLWPTKTGAPEERTNYMVQGWMYAIPVGSPNPDAAWDFMKYAFVDESAKMGYLTLNGPCVISAFPAFLEGLKGQIGADNRIVPYLDVFTQTGETATKFWPVIPVNSFYNNELNRIYGFVVRGDMTAQEGLDEVTKNVQAELDKS